MKRSLKHLRQKYSGDKSSTISCNGLNYSPDHIYMPSASGINDFNYSFTTSSSEYVTSSSGELYSLKSEIKWVKYLVDKYPNDNSWKDCLNNLNKKLQKERITKIFQD